MPFRESMRWIPSQRRWRKMYRGKQYYISARQLGCTEETKDASRERANDWWTQKRAEIDLASRPVARRQQQPLDDVLAALIGSAPWTDQAAMAMGAVQYLKSLPPSPMAEHLAETAGQAAMDDAPDHWEQVASLIGKALLPRLLESLFLRGEPLPDALRSLPPARLAQLESAAKIVRGESATAPDKTVKAMAGVWMDKQQSMVQVGEMTPARHYNVAGCIRHFAMFLGETADVSCVDAARLEGYHRFCLGKITSEEWSTAFAREVFSAARRWVKWLWERGAIELPRNLNSRWRFGSVITTIPTMTVDEVQSVIGGSSGKLKLALLLMANCGMTPKDVSDLQDSEVAWDSGRIIRKRSKTRKQKSAPEVCYKLWPITFELLQKHRSRAEYVLLTARGKPYGKNFSTMYERLAKRIGFKKPMKLLRKTGATALDSFDPSGAMATLYLGHSPRSMKDRHYSRPNQSRFDDAIAWLGRQFDFIDP